jgi:preprotein translocase subunit SecF
VVDIIGKRYWYFALSLLVIIPGLVAMGIHWAQFGEPFRLAIDFTGGTAWEITGLKAAPSSADVISVFDPFGIRDVRPQPTDRNGVPGLIIRSSEIRAESKADIDKALRAKIGDYTELRFESVGPQIGTEISQGATFAVGLAAIGILLYLTWAFRRVPQPFRYGVAAVVAMIHDIFVVVGTASIFGLLFGWEVDSLFLTALLTVIGFSVHDTIVVFDRIRENIARLRGVAFEKVVNHSILQTLDRSINTQLTVLLTLSALALFGGITIRHFVLTLFIGILSGSYSSIFNAAPILVVWENGEIGKFFSRGRAAA